MATLTASRLESRESIERFIVAGKAIFTVVSKATGKRFTFKVKLSDDGDIAFVSVLSGSDNTSDYTYLGIIRRDHVQVGAPFDFGSYRSTRGSRVSSNAPSQLAARWFFGALGREDAEQLDKCEVWHEGRCCRCDPESIEAGIGPKCAGEVQ
jgi:hypothetical protein